jgi:hypothetical protein
MVISQNGTSGSRHSSRRLPAPFVTAISPLSGRRGHDLHAYAFHLTCRWRALRATVLIEQQPQGYTAIRENIGGQWNAARLTA